MSLPFRLSEPEADTLRLIAGSEIGRSILAQHAAEELERRRETVKARDKALAALAVASRKRDTVMTVAEAGVKKARAALDAAMTELHDTYCAHRSACHVHESAAGRADLDLLATAPAAINDFIQRDLHELRENMKTQPPGYVAPEYADALVTAERAASAMKLEALTDAEVADRLATLRKHIERKAPRAGMQAA